MLKTKRTYNLSRRTIETVRSLVIDRGVAPTQDALVELAVDEFARHIREADEAETWTAAANDREFIAESDALEAAYQTADAETWAEDVARPPLRGDSEHGAAYDGSHGRQG